MLVARDVRCPSCGEPVVLMVDVSAGDQAYIEDCSVCCRPMSVFVRSDGDGTLDVAVRRDDDT